MIRMNINERRERERYQTSERQSKDDELTKDEIKVKVSNGSER